MAAFPDAKVIDKAELEHLSAGRWFLLIAPVKGNARVRVKVEEYADEFENDPAKWPFAKCLGDLIRATVLTSDMDAFAEAWQRLESEFQLAEDRGRLKVRVDAISSRDY